MTPIAIVGDLRRVRVHFKAALATALYSAVCASSSLGATLQDSGSNDAAARHVGAYAIQWCVDPNDYRYYTVDGDPSGVRVYTLENGLTVYLARNDDEPRIRSIIVVRGGAAFDPPDNTGVAHYLEHLMFDGTDEIGALNWSKEEPLLERIEGLYEQRKAATSEDEKRAIDRKIDGVSVEASQYAEPGEYRKLASSLGAVMINGYTNYDLTAYWCLIPSASLEKHLILERERFSRPALRAFQSELEVVYEEFNVRQDHVQRRKEDALRRLLYPHHPYGRALIGLSEHLKNPSLRAIRAYYDSYYVPGNMAVVLVGDLDYDETIRLVGKYFGGLEARGALRPTLPQERPITAPRISTIYGPGQESVYFGFRMDGAGSRDEKLAMLMDMVLNNGSAGLFDTALNAKQAVGRAGSTVQGLDDYTVHYFDGYPKEGQSLEEVRDLMLAQIERVKRGDFDEWLMTGAVNDLKKLLMTRLSTSINLSAECMHSFKRGETWSDYLSFVDELSSVTKQELVDFAKRNYGDNYALVFERNGEADVVRVEKPPITPRNLNAEAESAFAKDLARIEIPFGQPRFVDYDQALATAQTRSGVEVSFVPNSRNDLFELVVLFDMGRDHDRKLALAAEYCNLIGTDAYSFDELKRKLYELGLTLSSYSTSDQTGFRLEGLQDHLATGIELLDHFMGDLVPDETAYSSLVDRRLKERQSTLTDSDAILYQGLLSYALYGEHSSLRNVFSEAELRAISPAELTGLIKGLRGYEHRIFFYGKDLRQALDLLDSSYHADPKKKAKPRIKFRKQPTPNAVNFVNLDMVQAKAIVVARGKLFDAARIGPSNFYGPYIDHVVFRDIREARSLAYATSAAHLMARRPGDFDFTYVFAGTRADKLPETLQEMVACMTECPGTAGDVRFVRDDQLKRYQSERITGQDIFWSHERLRRQGLTHDIRKEMYAAAQAMTMDRIKAFFEENIRGRDKCILVVGSKDHIDMDALATFGDVVELEPTYLFNY
jgi:zinc protease